MSSANPTPEKLLTDEALRQQAAALGGKLRAAALSVATAESCTGGWIAKVFTDVAGSSAWFNGGVVTYSNEAKHRLLAVESDALRKHGAVSELVVRQMALGALDALGAHCAVSVSGVAGPDGGSPAKPVGLVWIGAAVRRNRPDSSRSNAPSAGGPQAGADAPIVHVKALEHHFKGSREVVRRASVAAAMQLLIQVLDSA